jgi:hypothetical protein
MVALVGLVSVNVTAYGEGIEEVSLLDKIKDIYMVDADAESKNVPFVYYINEAGFMIGDFYYNTNLFDNETKLTSVIMYAPGSDMITSFNDLRDYPLTEKLSLGAKLKVIKYNDIKNGAIGNDSSNEEIPEEYMNALHKFKGLEGGERDFVYGVATGQITEKMINDNPTYQYLYNKNKDLINTLEDDRDKLDGYQLYHGWNNSLGFNLTYDINENNAIISEYNYEELTSQVRDYKSDTISVAWENKDVDNENNPREGHRVITRVKKSLDLLGHDNENNWDYMKYTLDFRKYFPVFKNSTLAVRMRTQSTTGEKRIDQERSALLKFQTGDPTAAVYTYAPFFDMSLLGDLDTMKGYNYYRFYDNNSVLYQTELRIPMDHILTGLQGNIYFEAGRVSADFDKELFTKDMHYSGGLGVRYFFNEHVIIRTDVGVSEEGTQFRMNIGQTF